MNYNLKINLAKLNGVCKSSLKDGKKVLVIPIEENYLFEGSKGCYLDVVAYEFKEQHFDDSHYLKVQVKKEVFEKMDENEKKSIPIIGSMKEITFEFKKVELDNTEPLSEDDDDF